MNAPTTHLLDMEFAGFGRRFPDRPFPAPLCGAAETGPLDLAPYNGAITCDACRAWDGARNAPVLDRES